MTLEELEKLASENAAISLSIQLFHGVYIVTLADTDTGISASYARSEFDEAARLAFDEFYDRHY